jgi:hypothetical protein
VVIRYKWGAKTEEEHFRITWNNNRRRLTVTPSKGAAPQKERKHNIVFLNAELVKIAYSGPGFSDRNDGKHSFCEVEGASTGDMVGLVARFRNDAIYGEDVEAVHAVRAHLKLSSTGTVRRVAPAFLLLSGSGIQATRSISSRTAAADRWLCAEEARRQSLACCGRPTTQPGDCATGILS